MENNIEDIIEDTQGTCELHMIDNENDYICPDCIEQMCQNNHND